MPARDRPSAGAARRRRRLDPLVKRSSNVSRSVSGRSKSCSTSAVARAQRSASRGGRFVISGRNCLTRRGPRHGVRRGRSTRHTGHRGYRHRSRCTTRIGPDDLRRSVFTQFCPYPARRVAGRRASVGRRLRCEVKRSCWCSPPCRRVAGTIRPIPRHRWRRRPRCSWSCPDSAWTGARFPLQVNVIGSTPGTALAALPSAGSRFLPPMKPAA